MKSSFPEENDLHYSMRKTRVTCERSLYILPVRQWQVIENNSWNGHYRSVPYQDTRWSRDLLSKDSKDQSRTLRTVWSELVSNDCSRLDVLGRLKKQQVIHRLYVRGLCGLSVETPSRKGSNKEGILDRESGSHKNRKRKQGRISDWRTIVNP